MTAMHRVRCIHMIGIGGVGMAGIAEVLMGLGYQVQGSNLGEVKSLDRLRDVGAKVFTTHDALHMQGADVVVVSSAIPKANPEWQAALAAGIPVVPRAAMLAELMRFKQGIAIAGTHGKTTTTSLVATVLAEANLDPTYVIGGQLSRVKANAKLGEGEYLVCEADESDQSFLHLSPMMSVITNIEADHMENYGGDLSNLYDVFLQFIHNLPFYGVSIVCLDDPGVQAVLPKVQRRVVTYGVHEQADVRAEHIEYNGTGSQFNVMRAKQPQQSLRVNLPGKHNVLNALAAVAVADELGVNAGAIERALSEFAGIGRRFQVRGEAQGAFGAVTLVDDYAHHPTEVAATLTAARAAFPGRRIVGLFQPHRYSRTQALFNEFVQVLSEFDALCLSPVYPAGESPIDGADAPTLAKVIQAQGQLTPFVLDTLSKAGSVLSTMLQDQDVLLMMGAGSIGAFARSAAEHLAHSATEQVG